MPRPLGCAATKVFTSLLLADMVRRGEVGLEEPVTKYLPAGIKIPAGKSGRSIALLDLATHTSGLPLRFTFKARGGKLIHLPRRQKTVRAIRTGSSLVLTEFT